MDWVLDEAQTKRFIHTHRIEKLLDANGGFVHIENFLPESAANAVLSAVKHLHNWEVTDGKQDASYHGAIGHRFSLAELDGSSGIAAEGDEANEKLVPLCLFGRLLWRLYRPRTTIPNFTAACYRKNDHIAPHDDQILESYTSAEVLAMAEQYEIEDDSSEEKDSQQETECEKDVSSDPLLVQNKILHRIHLQNNIQADGEAQDDYERQLAVVYYLNKGWKPHYGGAFLDLHLGKNRPKKYLPAFNSIVFFRVPRMHAVEAVKQKNANRMSIFGWWFSPVRKAPLPARVSETKGAIALESSTTKAQASRLHTVSSSPAKRTSSAFLNDDRKTMKKKKRVS